MVPAVHAGSLPGMALHGKNADGSPLVVNARGKRVLINGQRASCHWFNENYVECRESKADVVISFSRQGETFSASWTAINGRAHGILQPD